MSQLTGRSFLTLLDFTPEEIRFLLSESARFKELKRHCVRHRWLEGKNVALIFEKTSTRTRSSFEVAASDLGMGATTLDSGNSQMGAKESVEDTARVLGRIFDGICYRGYAQATVEKMAEVAGVPVWNALTDDFHPTQMIADFLTIQEEFGTLEGKKLAFFGDARNNVANSLMVASAKLGVHFVACGPEALMPAKKLVETCRAIAEETGGSVTLTEDPKAAAAGADALYTDIWLSMGEPKELWEERIHLLEPYRVTPVLMAKAHKDAIFLHCLPSFHDRETTVGEEIYQRYGLREMEVADKVFRGPRSRVFDEAENRMHSIKAVMYSTLC